MTRVFFPCIRQPHTKEEAADDGTTCRPDSQSQYYFYLFFLRFLSQFWFLKPFQWVNRRLGGKKINVEAYSCPCPANKLRVSSLRWPPQEATKKAQGKKKLKTKNKSGWGLPKMSPNCRQKSFQSTLKFQTSNHLCSTKKNRNLPSKTSWSAVVSAFQAGRVETRSSSNRRILPSFCLLLQM